MSRTKRGWLKVTVASAAAGVSIMAMAATWAIAQNLQGPGGGELSASPLASPDVRATGKRVILFNVKGVFSLLSDTGGACGSATCSVGDTCECQNYEADGIRSSAFGAGKVNITFDETLDGSQVIPAGVSPSNCRPFFGTGTVTGPLGVTDINFFASGWSCGMFPLFADFATFYFIPGSGAGALANARGTGTLNFTKDFSTNEAIFYMAGDLQKKP